ncbi:MAG: DUF2383 domain-containing protein [Gloeobacteraceae cyanobacterium ES-bin-144]|nr:DUF2383 domain-containing protein [Verrucomicrobiales bacterium]
MISTLIMPWSLRLWVKHNQVTNQQIKNTMNSNETITDTCNALLRGELSAIETYTQAIEKFGKDAGVITLETIRTDHMANAESLRKLVGECGEKPATSSGLWGTFATTVEGVATLFGESPALIILQQGEEHGISQYEDALEDDELSEAVKNLIRETLLPAQRRHLVELELCKTNAA